MLNLDSTLIRAALIFAAKTDCRTYLTGIAIENTPDACFIVGCDGHRLLVCRDEPQDHARGVLILGRTELEAAMKKWPKKLNLVAEENPDGTYTLNQSILASPLEGRYPDWRRVVPRTTSGVPGHFDAAYLGSIAKVCEALRGRPGMTGGYIIEHNGPKYAARILFPGYSAVGVLMTYVGPTGADTKWLDSALDAHASENHEYRILDTFTATLRNEPDPGRDETVTEIQAADGELLCYANPDNAELIVRACTAHDALVTALQRLIPFVSGDGADELTRVYHPDYINAAADAAQAALILAGVQS